MNKQQWALVLTSILLLAGLYFFGNTVAPNRPAPAVADNSTLVTLTSEQVISKYKTSLDTAQLQKILQMENSVVRGDVHNQQVHIYHQLASYWADTLHRDEIGAYYTGEAAKLENSEKNLTFAAHLLLENMMSSTDVSMNKWMATQAKELFEKALSINPNNDSSKIGLGACYMFGNISDNPMQGILAIKQIADKDSGNMYAQMMLGLGGVQSGQYDKAVERFLNVLRHQPDNVEAILNLAGTYERMGDKANAVKWYQETLKFVTIPEAKKDIEERIKSLQ